jgi:hypothetical protein
MLKYGIWYDRLNLFSFDYGAYKEKGINGEYGC